MDPFRVVHQGSSSYPVYVGGNYIGRLGEVRERLATRGRTFAIVAKPVLALYGDAITRSLPDAELIPFDDGEERKTLANAEMVVTEMLQRGVRRDSIAFVIGGGVTGDAAGFACSIVLRGIGFVHVPTTLLAQVDSSIGGKLGVNHAAGKNLIGTFAPPLAVVADVSLLATLSRWDLISGAFEALKSGVINDPTLFEMVERGIEHCDLTEVVKRSIEVKAAVVERDALETGDRKLLNYGHTIGHAIENALNYRHLTHGEAVGWGMIAANAVAVARGLLDRGEAQRIDQAVIALSPRSAELHIGDLVSRTTHDKKFTAAKRVMILPRRIGDCIIVDDITPEEMTAGCAAMIDRMRSGGLSAADRKGEDHARS